jgi:hypothetical protein
VLSKYQNAIYKSIFSGVEFLQKGLFKKDVFLGGGEGQKCCNLYGKREDEQRKMSKREGLDLSIQMLHNIHCEQPQIGTLIEDVVEEGRERGSLLGFVGGLCQ